MGTPALVLFGECSTLHRLSGKTTTEGTLVRETYEIGLREPNGVEKTATLVIECDTQRVQSVPARHKTQLAGVRPLLPGEDHAVSVWEEDLYPEPSFGRPVSFHLAYGLQGVDMRISVECDGHVTAIPTDLDGWFLIGHYAFDIRCRWFPDLVLKALAEAVWQEHHDEEHGGWTYDPYLPDPFHSSDAFLFDPRSYLASTTVWGSCFVVELGRELFSDGSFFLIEAHMDSAAAPSRGAFSASVFQTPDERETWLVVDVVGHVTLTRSRTDSEKVAHVLSGQRVIRNLDESEEAPLHVWIRYHQAQDTLPILGYGDLPGASDRAKDLQRLPMLRGVAAKVIEYFGAASREHLNDAKQIGQYLYGITEQLQVVESAPQVLIKPVRPPPDADQRSIVVDWQWTPGPEHTLLDVALPRDVELAVQAEATRQDRSRNWILSTAVKVAVRDKELRLAPCAAADRGAVQRLSLPVGYVDALKQMADQGGTDVGVILGAMFLAARDTLARFPSVN